MRVIVSMTSWTKRIGNVKTVLDSLVNQNKKPDLIELNLSLEEFQNRESDLPVDLQGFIKDNACIEINWVDGNDGVFKKIIPTLKKFYGDEYLLLSVDDDWIYRSDYVEFMIKKLYEYQADSFCMANSNVIGNRMVYKSSCFEPDFWQKLTKEVINTRIDDSYITHYLTSKRKKMSHYRPNDAPDMTKRFNPVCPNSHNEQTGSYDSKEVSNAEKLIRKIKF